MKSYKIAVLIINYNSWKLLEKCLEALAMQTYQEFNTLVLDNGDRQNISKDIINRFPNVKFYHCNLNLGFADANNDLIKLTYDYDWIATLNPDAFPEPNWLEALIKAALKYRDYSFFASRLLMADFSGRLDGDGDSYHFSGLAYRAKHGCKRTVDNSFREVFSACAAAGFYSRKALIEVGGFDEDFFCYFEDVDLGFRLRLKNKKCLLVSGAIVYHMGSATSGGRMSEFAIYHGHRNIVWGFVKNMPGILFWTFGPFHFIINLFSVFWFSLKGKRKVIMKAKLDALKGLPKMWKKRKEIQKKRNANSLDIIKVMDKCPIPMLDRLTHRIYINKFGDYQKDKVCGS